MKLFSIVFTAAFLILNSCSKSTKPDTATTGDSSYPPKDNIKIASIDTLARKIDKLWKPDSTYHVVAFNQRDTLKYIEVNGKTPRISSIFTTDSTLIWVLFHMDNDELKLVRYREKIDKPTPSVRESFSYLEDGKIIFSKERGKNLNDAESVGAFRSLPFDENKSTPAEMLAEYESFWKMTKEAVDRDMAARKQAH
ncbi:MAG: hypothetical protein IT258_06835 [Saprospiraceae bacterium]|nr:hypothetical protein [Saprospiraceae bacterium]